MADDGDDAPSYADGSLAHPNGPNAYGPPMYQLKSGGSVGQGASADTRPGVQSDLDAAAIYRGRGNAIGEMSDEAQRRNYAPRKPASDLQGSG